VGLEEPDLSAFLNRGGKLLLYHGWADPQTRAGNTIRYFESVKARVGAQRAADGVRLFMAPGMGHCAGGEGPDTFDAIAPLQRWVEKGEVPKTIEAALVRDGKVLRTRPLCAFGTTAVWDGRGDPAQAASFACQPSAKNPLISP
jgi:feruloyl esterase